MSATIFKRQRSEQEDCNGSAAIDLRRTDFRFKRALGRGTFGKVHLVEPKDPSRLPGAPREVAIKVVDDPLLSFRRNSLSEEYEAHALVSGHPNIPAMFGMFQIVHRTYLVMELLGGGSCKSDLEKLLYEHVKQQSTEETRGLPEKTALEIALQVASALRFMHEKGVVHRDISLDNIAVCNFGVEDGRVNVKLIDFGMATMFDPSVPESRIAPAGEWCGSGRSMPPQMHAGEQSDMTKADVFSFGTVLYALLSGKMPFGSDDRTWAKRHVTFLKQKTGSLHFNETCWSNVQKCTRELVTSMLSPTDAARPTAQELEDFLRDALCELNEKQVV